MHSPIGNNFLRRSDRAYKLVEFPSQPVRDNRVTTSFPAWYRSCLVQQRSVVISSTPEPARIALFGPRHTGRSSRSHGATKAHVHLNQHCSRAADCRDPLHSSAIQNPSRCGGARNGSPRAKDDCLEDLTGSGGGNGAGARIARLPRGSSFRVRGVWKNRYQSYSMVRPGGTGPKWARRREGEAVTDRIPG